MTFETNRRNGQSDELTQIAAVEKRKEEHGTAQVTIRRIQTPSYRPHTLRVSIIYCAVLFYTSAEHLSGPPVA